MLSESTISYSEQQRTLKRTMIADASLLRVLKVVVAMVTAMWISIPFALQLLVVVGLFECLSSMINPTRSFYSALHKVCISIGVTLFVCIISDMAKKQAGLNLGFDLCSAVGIFYCFSSGIRIIHDVEAAGMDLPPVLINLLDKVEGLTGAEKQEIKALKLKQGQEIIALDLKQSESLHIETVKDPTAK